MTFSNAQAHCNQYGGELATPDDLLNVYDNEEEFCEWGWVSDGSVRRVVQSSSGCGPSVNTAGVVDMGPSATDNQWGVYCIQRSRLLVLRL